MRPGRIREEAAESVASDDLDIGVEGALAEKYLRACESHDRWCRQTTA